MCLAEDKGCLQCFSAHLELGLPGYVTCSKFLSFARLASCPGKWKEIPTSCHRCFEEFLNGIFYKVLSLLFGP